MSRVVVATAYGGPEELAVVNEALDAPGPGEARIKVRASGVNPVDYKTYSGSFGSDLAGFRSGLASKQPVRSPRSGWTRSGLPGQSPSATRSSLSG